MDTKTKPLSIPSPRDPLQTQAQIQTENEEQEKDMS